MRDQLLQFTIVDVNGRNDDHEKQIERLKCLVELR